ncbi:MAG: flagellar basal body rod protein FlgB [Methyloligellaceae bacterium]
MALGDLKLFSFLKTKMQWHQARQRVLAENVANADTPRYRPNDLKPVPFESGLAVSGLGSVLPARTNVAHIKGAAMQSEGAFKASRGTGWEVTPAGNAVVLEEQMIKVSENQFDFQMASTLYSRSMGLLRTAVGRNS